MPFNVMFVEGMGAICATTRDGFPKVIPEEGVAKERDVTILFLRLKLQSTVPMIAPRPTHDL